MDAQGTWGRQDPPTLDISWLSAPELWVIAKNSTKLCLLGFSANCFSVVEQKMAKTKACIYK